MEVNGNGLGKVRGRGRILAHGFFMLNSGRCKGDCAIRRLTQTYNVFCWKNQIRSSQSQIIIIIIIIHDSFKGLGMIHKCSQNLSHVRCFNVVIWIWGCGSVHSFFCTSIISETVTRICVVLCTACV